MVCTCTRTGMGCHSNHGVYCLIPESPTSHSPSSVRRGPRRILIAVSIVTLCAFIKLVQSLPLLLCAVCSMKMTCHSLQGTHAWSPNMVRLKRVSLYTTKNIGNTHPHLQTFKLILFTTFSSNASSPVLSLFNSIQFCHLSHWRHTRLAWLFATESVIIVG